MKFVDGYQAIVTKYLGATNRRGARVKATCSGGSVTLDWDDALPRDGNHRAAAMALARRMGWIGNHRTARPEAPEFVMGGLPNSDGRVFVQFYTE